MGLFVYRLLKYVCCSGRVQVNNSVIDDMKLMMDEISLLSMDEREENCEKYYILTNLLVNRFRIEVYEKILK
jgi:hypothetical protein